jgi:molybdopterin molybdotransferase
MSGFVEEVRPIEDCLRFAAEKLGFPWQVKERRVALSDALLTRSSRDIRASEPSPPFTRSLRDGYAVKHSITTGASTGSPVFLRFAGEVVMGEAPGFSISGDETAAIPTGGMLPEGADAVVMIEDTAASGGWVEVRRSVQRNENLIRAGEEIAHGDVLIRAGEMIDCAATGLLATFGISQLDVLDTRIGVISTGDEIVPIESSPLRVGFIRDANTFIVESTLKRYGWRARSYGIAPDNWQDLKTITEKALAECDVVLLSGGSSVGVRDHAVRIMKSLPEPGLLVHGINMTPGKPTLIGGSTKDDKLVAGLPGHPLSCMVAVIFVVLPLLLAMSGAPSTHAGRYIKLPLAGDVQGHTGPDEFIPMRIENGEALQLAAKSSYVSAMINADGFVRMRPNTETLRKGEEAEIWLW